MDSIKNSMQIKIEKLKKRYHNFLLRVDELTIDSPEIVGIIGNNGAGKTTLLKLILDLIKSDLGTVFSDNIPVMLSDHWKNYTGSFLDEDFLIQFLTPIEFYYFIGKVYKISTEEIDKEILKYADFLNFDVYSKKYIRDYSIGNKYKIGIVSTLLIKPKILIFDEPFNYLDPKAQNQLVKILRGQSENDNVIVIISSHDLEHIAELCTRVLYIENGVILNDIGNIDKEITRKKLRGYFDL